MAVQNIAVKLCGILQSQSNTEISAREWRLIGQEQDGSQLFTWISHNDGKELFNIGIYTNKTKSFVNLHTFNEKLNIIQASVNSSHSLLVYVVKFLPNEDSVTKEPLYFPYLLSLSPGKDGEPIKVEEGSGKQIMVQYVYGKTHKYSPGERNDRFLLFKHLECIKIYRTTMMCKDCDDGTEEWAFEGGLPEPDTIVRVFSWAQWDCVNQVLYYIHYRQPVQSFAEGEEVKSPSEVTPTLSALQLHADLPHETVLNIPLSVPQSNQCSACGEYEDDPVPLRVHDCSLDLLIVADPSGVLCICHHYLYKPLDSSQSSLILEDSSELKESGVNFAYSITLLHHGCVLHSVVPDLPWALAKSLRPSYTLCGAHHLIVTIPLLFTHVLDVCASHEPCRHVVLPAEGGAGDKLAALLGWGAGAAVAPRSLDVLHLAVPQRALAATFKSRTPVENKLAILHYLLQHEGAEELPEELITWACLNQHDGQGGFQRIMQEFLIGATYAVTKRSLPSSALGLMRLLPFTTPHKLTEVKVGDFCVSVSEEKLWSVSVVVLAPRQRVNQFATDLWTNLWTALNPKREPNRFQPTAVLTKLAVSLHCYQPEALSRCSTPMSPTGPAPSLGATSQRRSSLGGAHELLPFFELDVCTASRQEHIIAANLREVSVHLMRGTSTNNPSKKGVESGVHAVATRWTSAQLDVSRALCRMVCKAVSAIPATNQQRGFSFIDEMEPSHALVLFKVLEQYYLAAESIAFPQPQGFASFFAYLGYRTLPFHSFVQYVHRSVLELQIDVIKAILAAKDEDSTRTINNKLRLISVSGSARARRALATWRQEEALILRARDHANTLLSGERSMARRPSAVVSAGMPPPLPGEPRLSPLDTFLDLLTAKASLNELDFNLIIEATLASIKTDATV